MVNGEYSLSKEKVLHESLYLSGKVNTTPEDRFDRLTRMAVRMFGVSMSAIAVADADCYRFKSVYGFGQTQAPVEAVLSRKSIDADSVLHVPDATLHEKFMNSPMVVGSPFVRFYLGVPLLDNNGQKAGVFCIMDSNLKVFDKNDFAAFVDFSELVQKELIGSEIVCPATFEQGMACPIYKTNQRFQKFAVNVPGMVYQQVLHPDGSDEYLYLSPGAGDLYGVEYQSLLKNPKLMLKRFHPDDIRELISSLNAAIENCRQWNWECRIITPSGKLKWLQGMANPERLPDGDILWDGLVLDITERKLAEEQIRTMGIAVEQSASTIVITDTEGRIQYVNKKFSEITGYDFGEVRGENPRVLNSGRQSKDYYVQLWDTILAGNQWVGEFCNKKKNGELYWESVTIAPVRDVRGKLTNFIAIKEDITSRMIAEARLRNSEQMLASIFSTLKTGVFLTDKDGYFTALNEAFCQI
ncbi:MAG: PAS domain S-box protein, partial [Chlorobiales bacterium]|nr:PAS domain S-box protein [Chlorobiales bacterium]